MPSPSAKKFSPDLRVRSDGAAAMVESIVGCKWSLIVLQLLRQGVNRPGAMERAVDGSVRQFWEVAKDGGKTWTVVFDGRYTRKTKL